MPSPSLSRVGQPSGFLPPFSVGHMSSMPAMPSLSGSGSSTGATTTAAPLGFGFNDTPIENSPYDALSVQLGSSIGYGNDGPRKTRRSARNATFFDSQNRAPIAACSGTSVSLPSTSSSELTCLMSKPSPKYGVTRPNVF